ncbi:hypothetical protein CR513_06276, partial [Mucuna pruriens]
MAITLRNYRDDILCDVVPMEATHILLGFQDMLERYKRIFPKEMPQGLPPFRGIEHHNDLIIGASLPNRPTYKANCKESTEIHKQVEKLLEK